MTTREAALQFSIEYFDGGGFQTDLAKMVAIPSESQSSEGRIHLQ